MLTERGLTSAERLLLHRRRLGITQFEAAQLLNISAWSYRQLEEGSRLPDRPEPTLDNLKDYEVCLILRRRANRTRSSVAKSVKISEQWLTQMERGRVPADRLIEYWKSCTPL